MEQSYSIDIRKAAAQRSNPLDDTVNDLVNGLGYKMEHKIQFQLPNGKVTSLTCLLAETVSMVKERLANENLCAYDSKFYFRGKYLMDPLSLNDFPEIIEQSKSNEPIFIEIK